MASLNFMKPCRSAELRKQNAAINVELIHSVGHNSAAKRQTDTASLTRDKNSTSVVPDFRHSTQATRGVEGGFPVFEENLEDLQVDTKCQIICFLGRWLFH